MTKLRLLLIDPQKLVREGIKKILSDTEFVVENETDDLPGTLSYLETGTCPDIILTELSDPGATPIAMLRAIREAAPEAKIVALSSGTRGLATSDALKAGVSGLLLKNISPRGFVHALELVVMGEKIFPIHSDFLEAGEEGTVPHPPGLDLSDREVKVLQCLAGGLSNKLIARELNVTETTVKAHVKTILRKIHAENRTQAAIWCLGNGLDHQPPAQHFKVAPLRNGSAPDGKRRIAIDADD